MLAPNVLRIDVISVEETPDERNFDADDLQIRICRNMDPLVQCRLSAIEPAFTPLNFLADEENLIRVMIHRGSELYGTISFNHETEFGHVGVSLTQWITLFEDVQDDIYDGSLGEDDEESPRVQLCFTTLSPEQAQHYLEATAVE